MHNSKCSCPFCLKQSKSHSKCCPPPEVIKGPEGPRGPQGCPGEPGRKGDTGDQGDKGDRGEKGEMGEMGQQGFIGLTGQQGEQGERGFTGAQGQKGDRGETGAQGAQGQQGSEGGVGQRGEKGDTGDTGATGAKGDTGDTGDRGERGEKGDKGDTGIQGAEGSSGFVSCTDPDEAGCFSVTFRDASGNPVVKQFQECVTLLACGYSGSAVCESPTVTGVVEESPTRKKVQFSYPSGMTGEVILEQTNSAASNFSVTGTQVSGNTVVMEVETDGKIRYNALLDKNSLPTAGECTAPLDAILGINGLRDAGGQLPQIQKEIGGAVAQTGFTQTDSTFNVEAGEQSSIFTDDTPAILFGNDASNLKGSMFTGNVDTFNRSTQRFQVTFEACWYSPVEVTADAAGNFLSAVDVNGNDIAENQVVIL